MCICHNEIDRNHTAQFIHYLLHVDEHSGSLCKIYTIFTNLKPNCVRVLVNTGNTFRDRGLKALTMNNRGAGLVVLLLRNPHLLERGERCKY